MISRSIPITFILLTFCVFITAQNFTSDAVASFETRTHDFGVLKMEDNKASYSFKVTNTGTNPLIIFNVKPSCGCTTSYWTKEPIPVGASGIVTAVYHTTTGLGKFRKTLAIFSNTKESPIQLSISGVVISDIPEVNRMYHFLLSDSLGMKRPSVNFKMVLNTQTVVEELEVANFSTKEVSISLLNPPPYIKMNKCLVGAGKQQRIPLEFIGSKSDFFGSKETLLTLCIDDGNKRIDTLRTFAVVNDDPDIWKGREGMAPRIAIDNMTLDFGMSSFQKTITGNFIIKNLGQSDLYIRKIYPSNLGLQTSIKSMVIKPNKEEVLQAKYNPGDKVGSQVLYISIITNDPQTPISKLVFKADINHP